MSIEKRNVQRFDAVRLIGPGTLKVTHGEQESLTIHAPAYVMPHVVSDVRNGVLHLGYRAPKIVSLRVFKEVISYALVMRDIRGLAVSGNGKIIAPDLDNDSISIALSGSGSVILEQLTADKLNVENSGSGLVRIAGDVEAQSVVIAGSGEYDARQLVSDFARVAINGSGDAHVSVSDDLSVNINGSGKVSYAGFPDISKQISGSGKLVRRRRDKPVNRGEEHG